MPNSGRPPNSGRLPLLPDERGYDAYFRICYEKWDCLLFEPKVWLRICISFEKIEKIEKLIKFLNFINSENDMLIRDKPNKKS